jgi:hypothetical protein
MAFKTIHARRNPATPGWAWAVAGLCGLLLIPVALENHRLVHAATPLRLAGPIHHPTPLALAGHSRSASRSPGQSQATARIPVVVGGGAAAVSQERTGDSGTAVPAATGGLDLLNPNGALGTANGAASLAGPAAVTSGRSLIGLLPDTGDGAALPWTGGRQAGDALGTRRTTPRATLPRAPHAGSTVLIRPRPATPKPRLWARPHGRPGPASRVRRRHNPRIYGFFVAAGGH